MSTNSEALSKNQTVSGVSATESISSLPCGLCKRQFSQYSCPKCNVPYCSLTCFRSPNHTSCSESFYKTQLEADIRSQPSTSTEERLRMMDMLKRFEDGSMDDEFFEDEGGDGEEDEEGGLEKRLGDLNLDSASYDDLWAALTPAERTKFLQALNDPNSELAQQLLTSEEIKQDILDPWWNSDSAGRGREPELIDVPDGIVKMVAGKTSGPSLLYNITGLLLAYAYATRYFGISPLSSLSPAEPEHEEARLLMGRLVPFLTDKRSTAVLGSLEEIVEALWGRFEQSMVTPQFMSFLLSDVEKLIRPEVITVVSSPDASSNKYTGHLNQRALLALSDLFHLFSSPSKTIRTPSSPKPTTSSLPAKSRVTPNQSHITAKLTFYAAHVVAVPPGLLKMIADEVVLQKSVVEREGVTAEQEGGIIIGTGSANEEAKRKSTFTGPRIEVLE